MRDPDQDRVPIDKAARLWAILPFRGIRQVTRVVLTANLAHILLLGRWRQTGAFLHGRLYTLRADDHEGGFLGVLLRSHEDPSSRHELVSSGLVERDYDRSLRD
jgi:hypothetical protein